jgi:hypothetical protein
MTEMRIGDQAIRYDRDATAAAYWTLEHGFAEKCGCLFCKNFTLNEIWSTGIRLEHYSSSSALIRTKSARRSSTVQLTTDATSMVDGSIWSGR